MVEGVREAFLGEVTYSSRLGILHLANYGTNDVHDSGLIFCASVYTFFKICARLYCTITLGKKTCSEVVFFYQCPVYGKRSDLYETSGTCTHRPAYSPSPWVGQQTASTAPTHTSSHRAPEHEPLFPPSFLPGAIKYVYIRHGNMALRVTRETVSEQHTWEVS